MLVLVVFFFFLGTLYFAKEVIDHLYDNFKNGNDLWENFSQNLSANVQNHNKVI
jgi:hypothetical protein